MMCKRPIGDAWVFYTHDENCSTFDGSTTSSWNEMLGDCIPCEYAAVVNSSDGTTWPHVYYSDPETGESVMRGGG